MCLGGNVLPEVDARLWPVAGCCEHGSKPVDSIKWQGISSSALCSLFSSDFLRSIAACIRNGQSPRCYSQYTHIVRSCLQTEKTQVEFDFQLTVHRDKFLIIKPTRCTNFSNLFLERNM